MSKPSLSEDEPGVPSEVQIAFLEFVQATYTRILDEEQALETGNMNDHVRSYRQGRLDGMKELLAKFGMIVDLPGPQSHGLGPYRSDVRQ
jgi:hypothetical protein